MEPSELIDALQHTPPGVYRDLIDVLQFDVSPETLVAALAVAPDSGTRQTLLDVLGSRGAPEAVDALIGALSDPTSSVRASAADALGKVFLLHPDAPGRERAGAALLARWEVEPNPGP